MLAHFGIPGPAPFVAVGLFFSGVGAALGAYRFSRHGDPRTRKIGTIGLGVISLTCFLLVTFFPVFLGARPSLGRALDGGEPDDGIAASGRAVSR